METNIEAVITSFNQGSMILEAVQSLCKQTIAPKRIIIVDDGSTDKQSLNILDNIQTILASQINIEQNKIIKIFTVATVAMMPPTLIGTVYGMNFKFMPELDWRYGYLFAWILMAVIALSVVLFFRGKKWK